LKTKSLKQKILFKGIEPETLYKMMMDSKKHSAFTGDAARISPKVGGRFTAYGDYIEGKNLELKPPKKIVQAWRASDWKEGHLSKVTFEFKKTKQGTTLVFTHAGVPADQAASIKDGWYDFYWTPMKQKLGLE
jgi:activator of HSP90 ATPase